MYLCIAEDVDVDANGVDVDLNDVSVISINIPQTPLLLLPMIKRASSSTNQTRTVHLPSYLFLLYSFKEGEEVDCTLMYNVDEQHKEDKEVEPIFYRVLPSLSLFKGESLSNETISKALDGHPISPNSLVPIVQSGGGKLVFIQFVADFKPFISGPQQLYVREVDGEVPKALEVYDFSEFKSFFTMPSAPPIMLRISTGVISSDSTITTAIPTITSLTDSTAIEYDFRTDNLFKVALGTDDKNLIIGLKASKTTGIGRELGFFLRMAIPSILSEGGIISSSIKTFVERYLGGDVDVNYNECLLDSEDDDEHGVGGDEFFCKEDHLLIKGDAYDEFLEYLRLSLRNKNGGGGSAFIDINGILVHGASGTGKTEMILSCLQKERSSFHKLITVKAVDIIDRYLGASEENLRNTFSKARSLQKKSGKPVVMLIDSIELLGGSRRSGGAISEDDCQSTLQTRLLSTLLNELDGVDGGVTDKIVLIATTSIDIEKLDEALIRPGRLDRHVQLKLLTKEEQIQVAINLGYSITAPPSPDPLSVSRLRQILFNKYSK